jgi:tRNA threonylcarbamoyl adenosine modification protein YjeE
VNISIRTSGEMRKLGSRIGKLLVAGDVVVLDGPLGAGKTTLVQGLGEQLGVVGAVTSPTFVVSRIHKASTAGLALVHVDAYRLASGSDLVDLDLDHQQNAVFVIEWGLPYIADFTDDWLEVHVSRDDELTDEADPASGLRDVSLVAVGKRWQSVDLAKLAQ